MEAAQASQDHEKGRGKDGPHRNDGPAGENLVRFACIKSDKWRSLGRCGLGAVLGSKNLKGLSFRGNQKAKIADDDLLRDCGQRIARKGQESPVSALYRKYGTPMQAAIKAWSSKAPNTRRSMPSAA